jgi:hypothetical protein
MRMATFGILRKTQNEEGNGNEEIKWARKLNILEGLDLEESVFGF